MKKQYKNIYAVFFLALSFGINDVAWAGQKNGTGLRKGFPGRRIGAGTRDGLENESYQLTALVPKSNFSQTINPTPSLYFYFPKTEQPKLVELVVRDDQDQQIHMAMMLMPPEAEFAGLKLAKGSDALPLELDRNYHWYVSIILEPNDRSKDIVVDGWIRRIATPQNLEEKLAITTQPMEQAALYQQEGIWQDAVTMLADLHQTNPHSPQVRAQWHELLQSVGLGRH